jgi:hypothetical protein
MIPSNIEPLNEWQRNAMQGLATMNHGDMLEGMRTQANAYGQNPSAQAQRFIDPAATAAIGNMGGAISQGTQRFGGDALSRYMNPYTQEVIDRSLSGINRDEATRRASLEAGMGVRGARSFGNQGRDIQMSELARNMDSLRGKTRSELNYQGFNNAVGQFNTEQDRILSGAGMYGNQANIAQNVFNSGNQSALNSIGMLGDASTRFYDERRKAAEGKLGVGNQLQQFNQGIANAAAQEMGADQAYDWQQIQNAGAAMNPFLTGQASYTQTPNWANKLGGAMTAVSDQAGQAIRVLGGF